MINMAMLLGRVGKKESKPLKNGGEIVILSVATSRKYKDSTGTAQEQTTWHNVNCFSKLADVVNRYVHVGDLVFVQGEIQNRKVESGERAGQYMYSVQATEVKFLPKGQKQDTPKEKTGDIFSDDPFPF